MASRAPNRARLVRSGLNSIRRGMDSLDLLLLGGDATAIPVPDTPRLTWGWVILTSVYASD